MPPAVRTIGRGCMRACVYVCVSAVPPLNDYESRNMRVVWPLVGQALTRPNFLSFRYARCARCSACTRRRQMRITHAIGAAQRVRRDVLCVGWSESKSVERYTIWGYNTSGVTMRDNCANRTKPTAAACEQ